MKVASFIVTCLLIPALLHAQDASSQYTANHQRQALDIYRTVIGFRTAEGHGQVPKMASYLADLFRTGGFAAGDVHVLPLKLESGEETASLVVRYRGSNTSVKKPVLFLAHMDVVDAKREDWTRDPFTLVEEKGYFFGRGTLDDKSGVTLLTTTFLRLKAEGFVPARDLIVAYMAPYATDGSILRRAGIPTYGTIGLFFKASDDFSHGLNERVSVRSFFDALEYWHVVMTDLAGR